MLRGDVAQCNSLPLKPVAKARGEQNLPVNRIGCVSLRASRFSKRADMRHERALGGSQEHYFAIDEVLHGRLLSPYAGMTKESRLCRHTISHVLGNPSLRAWTRHSREAEIVPPMLSAT